jgi:LPXTG-motif cell wall-anchored protein
MGLRYRRGAMPRLLVLVALIAAALGAVAPTADAQQPTPILTLSNMTPAPGETVTLTVDCGVSAAELVEVAGIFGPNFGSAATVTPQIYTDPWPAETATGRSGPLTFGGEPGEIVLSVECFTAQDSNSGFLTVEVAQPEEPTTAPTTPAPGATTTPAAAVTTPAAQAPATGATTDPGALPATGTDSKVLWVLGIVVLLVGGTLVIRTRSRSAS